MKSDKDIVTVDSVSYQINEYAILDSINIDISEGEFVGIIGPNGAGKTTLLRLILGILKPSSGLIYLKGRRLDYIKPRERAAISAYLSQDIVPSFPYPVFDIALMGRYPHLGRFKKEGRNDVEIVQRALEYVGLSGFEDRYFNELSGGERQLTLFAKVLSQEAELLVLDEPTSNLDIKHRDQFFSMASELAREKKTVIAAVHNLDVASLYCTRLVLLSEGTLIADGKPEEVLKPEILDGVYGIKTVVSTNASTGSRIVNVIPATIGGGKHKIHLIGGAGSAINLTRELSRLGYVLSGGIAHKFDADERLWQSLGIEYTAVDAFSRISPEDVRVVADTVETADLTILCDFPVGPGNLENLRLAQSAQKLLIIEENISNRQRSFFAEDGETLFDNIKKNAQVMNYSETVDALESGSFFEALKSAN